MKSVQLALKAVKPTPTCSFPPEDLQNLQFDSDIYLSTLAALATQDAPMVAKYLRGWASASRLPVRERQSLGEPPQQQQQQYPEPPLEQQHRGVHLLLLYPYKGTVLLCFLDVVCCTASSIRNGTGSTNSRRHAAALPHSTRQSEHGGVLVSPAEGKL
ncbi:uncharacterized protein EMH_0023880 [Eimeria mitis]|uniref:Uncharacterized protein n=1 Tax=Eimeria mitis TaxID=44415 RepID=U6KAX0_9EIME|nr:uncharacterized protein EMH_0023880 [Eimeria mitis]CDJ35104.1 hypothetical protein EMH_0023880 [Eimeria mitis]